MEFRLLGSFEVVEDGVPTDVGALRQRALLVRLLLDANRTVAVERLVDDLWGAAVPGSAVKMIHVYVSQLRKALPPGVLITRPPGYVAQVAPESIDSVRFDRLRREGRVALEAGDAEEAAARLREALALWRGPPLAEFAEPFAEAERNHLEELRLTCLEDRVEADLRCGRHDDLAGELTAQVGRFPLRERLRAQLMLALYRAGRQVDALAVYRDFRATLDAELGLEPSAALRELQVRILNHDAALSPNAAPPRGPASQPALADGLAALARGDWEAARAAFQGAGEPPEALEGLAHAARFLGLGDESLGARARAFRGFRERGDHRSAARAAAWLAYDTVVFRGDDAVAQGWFAHAHRLLDAGDDCEETGWLAFLEGEVALIAHADPGRAGEHAALAREIGRRTGAMDLEMLGLSLSGLAQVAAGDIAPGLRELDHATAAAVAGEFSGPHFAGAVCCHMIYACERVHDVERAAQWCETVRGFSEQGDVPQLFGFCRSHYASVLMWRGEWAEAEAELDAAARAFERGAPALVYESILRLAQLRRRQGRADEAVELCERIPWHPAAQLCLAEITLERGDTEAARDLVDRHLRALPAAERLGRAPGLELAARIDIASGDLSAADDRCAELAALADAAGTAPLRASLRFARGLLARARGDVAGARRELVDAVDLWSRLEAPFELASGRLELAEVALGLERGDEAAREATLALAALERLGAAAATARAQALLERARGGLSVA